MKKSRSLLGLVLSIGLVFSAQAESSNDEKYFSSVMTILRAHIDTLVHLTHTPSIHSDNVVRHALAIHQTMGLFDHLDWTPERLSKLNVINGDSQATSEEFNLFARQARKNSRNLVQASKQWLDDGKRPALLQALNELTTSCNHCHTQLKNRQAPILSTIDIEHSPAVSPPS